MSALPNHVQSDAFTPPIALPAGKPVHLRVEVDYERLRFAYRVEGSDWSWLPQHFDASILSDEANAPGSPNFTGAFVGMACQDMAGTARPADFDYFEYREREFQRKPREVRAMSILWLLAATAIAAADKGSDGLTLVGLETQAAREPLGIASPAPRLSWKIASTRRGVLQAAYRVLVATKADLAREGKADVWDSKRVASADPWVDLRGSGARLAHALLLVGPRVGQGREGKRVVAAHVVRDRVHARG